jgi:hypothetical protein
MLSCNQRLQPLWATGARSENGSSERGSRWYPVVVAGTIVGGAAAFVLALATIMSKILV